MPGKKKPNNKQNRFNRPKGFGEPGPGGSFGRPGPQGGQNGVPGKLGGLPIVGGPRPGKTPPKLGFGGAGPSMGGAGAGKAYGQLPGKPPIHPMMDDGTPSRIKPDGMPSFDQGGFPVGGDRRRPGVSEKFINKEMAGYGDTIRGNQSNYGSGVSGAGGLFGKKQMRGLLESLANQGLGRQGINYLMDNPAAQMGLNNPNGGPMTGDITPDMIRYMREQGIYHGGPSEANHMKYQTDLMTQFPEFQQAYMDRVNKLRGGGESFNPTPAPAPGAPGGMPRPGPRPQMPPTPIPQGPPQAPPPAPMPHRMPMPGSGTGPGTPGGGLVNLLPRPHWLQDPYGLGGV